MQYLWPWGYVCLCMCLGMSVSGENQQKKRITLGVIQNGYRDFEEIMCVISNGGKSVC